MHRSGISSAPAGKVAQPRPLIAVRSRGRSRRVVNRNWVSTSNQGAGQDAGTRVCTCWLGHVIRRSLGAIGCWVMRRESWLNPEALRAARVRAGLTQHELARLVGVAGGERVSRWELGTSRPRPEILLRVASALDVSSTDLLDSNADLSDLRGLRIAAGLSMRDLAARTHLSKTTLSRWESGSVVQTPSQSVLALLAQSLGASVEEVERAIVRGRSHQ